MADGYGFGAEGDWKTAALTRAVKVMAAGLPGGTSFMEDYTYHLDPAGPKVLGVAHARNLSLARPRLPLRAKSTRWASAARRIRCGWSSRRRPARRSTWRMLDLGDRFRLLVNEVDAVDPEQPLPKLPVARALWSPRPDLKTAAAAWIYAGGPHHTVFSQAVTTECIEDFAEMIGVECLVIDRETRLTGVPAAATLEPGVLWPGREWFVGLNVTSRRRGDGPLRDAREMSLAISRRGAGNRIYCMRSEVAHKPEAQAKDSPSLALQACVSILPALSIISS